MEEQLAEHTGKAMAAFKQLNEEGMIVLDEEGKRRKNPLLEVWREHSHKALELLEEMGLTPASRAEE